MGEETVSFMQYWVSTMLLGVMLLGTVVYATEARIVKDKAKSMEQFWKDRYEELFDKTVGIAEDLGAEKRRALPRWTEIARKICRKGN